MKKPCFFLTAAVIAAALLTGCSKQNGQEQSSAVEPSQNTEKTAATSISTVNAGGKEPGTAVIDEPKESSVTPEPSQIPSETVSSELSEEPSTEISKEPSQSLTSIEETAAPEVPPVLPHKENSMGTEEISELLESVTPIVVKSSAPVHISECQICIGSILYGSGVREPDFYIVYQGNRLKKGIHYTVSFDRVYGIGKYEAYVEMKGGFAGTATETFEVRPMGTELRMTDNKVHSISLAWKAQTNFTDGYELQLSGDEDFSAPYRQSFSLKEPLTLTLPDLEENTVYYGRIRTYRDTKSGRIFSGYSEKVKLYTKPVEVIGGATYIDGVLVVNKTYSLPYDYGYGADDTALNAFYIMADAAAQDGLSLYIVSGYRSYDLQNYIYHNFCASRGQEGADMVSARPGHSEHQSGLAFDINSTAFAFSDTPEAKWLAENCYRYGFVIRYPKGKENITGYSYESWHIRYLGKSLAKTLHDRGLTLEEYFGITSRYAE